MSKEHQPPHKPTRSIPLTVHSNTPSQPLNINFFSVEPEIVNSGDPKLAEIIVDALKSIYDPELPVNIYDLGLIYKITINPDNSVLITMTLTTPGCPVAQTFPQSIAERIEKLDNIKKVDVEITWDPPWSPNRLSDVVKLQLGLI